MPSFGLALLAAGFVQGTALTPGQIAPATQGATVTKGTTGLANILVDQPIDITQVVVTISPGGQGPALGTIMSMTPTQTGGKLQLGIQSFRRDTGANVDTDFSFKVEQIPKNF